MITQDQLKSMFHYNQDTGIFTRLTRPCNSVQIGREAGYVQRFTKNLTYRRIEIDGKQHFIHRLAFLYMTGEMPNEHIDHIDGNGLNNAWANLRQVNRIQNLRNRKLNANNKSGHIGVSWYAPNGKWRAAINIESGKKKHIGYFNSIEDAVTALKAAQAANDYHENHGRKAA
jgi:hypothetical protein